MAIRGSLHLPLAFAVDCYCTDAPCTNVNFITLYPVICSLSAVKPMDFPYRRGVDVEISLMTHQAIK